MLQALTNPQPRVLLVLKSPDCKRADREPLIQLCKESSGGFELQVVGVLQHTHEDCCTDVGALARLAFAAAEEDVEVVDFVCGEFELFDVLVCRFLVDDAFICIDYMSFCLMTQNPFNRRDVKLASSLGDDFRHLSIRATGL